jgi:hypothetical protein
LVICHHGQSMTEAHYRSIINRQNIWIRCNNTFVHFERWPHGTKDVYVIIMKKIKIKIKNNLTLLK